MTKRILPVDIKGDYLRLCAAVHALPGVEVFQCDLECLDDRVFIFIDARSVERLLPLAVAIRHDDLYGWDLLVSVGEYVVEPHKDAIVFCLRGPDSYDAVNQANCLAAMLEDRS